METIKDALSGIVTILLMILAFVSWITAIVSDAQAGDVAWVVVDVVIAPIAIIRGFLMLIGVL